MTMAEMPPFRQGQEGMRVQPRDHPRRPKGLHSWYGRLDVVSLKGDLADPRSGRLVLRLRRWRCLAVTGGGALTMAGKGRVREARR